MCVFSIVSLVTRLCSGRRSKRPASPPSTLSPPGLVLPNHRAPPVRYSAIPITAATAAMISSRRIAIPPSMWRGLPERLRARNAVAQFAGDALGDRVDGGRQHDHGDPEQPDLRLVADPGGEEEAVCG